MSDAGERFFAVSAPGLEALLAEELAEHGIEGEAEPGGVSFEGGVREMHLVNLHSRLATRLLVRVAVFRARTFFELERHARRIPWSRYLQSGAALQLRVSCHKSKLYHEGAVEQRIRAAAHAMVPGLSAADATDEDGEPVGAAQLSIVRFLHDRCTVSMDTSGAALYRRGYRQAVARAPMRETLAAAMLRGCGWNGDSPLADPLCGSGTIPIEAALIARRIAPALANPSFTPREFAFARWPEHDPSSWNSLVDQARERVLPHARVPIVASDRDAGAVEAAEANAHRAGVRQDLEIQRAALSALEPPDGRGLLLVNPPYGIRVGPTAELRDLYAAIGRLAYEKLPGWTVALLSADPRLDGQLRIPMREAFRTRNGGIPVHLAVGKAPG